MDDLLQITGITQKKAEKILEAANEFLKLAQIKEPAAEAAEEEVSGGNPEPGDSPSENPEEGEEKADH